MKDKANWKTEEEMREMICDGLTLKVNLPNSREEYFDGNGEGIWAVADYNTLQRYRRNDCYDKIFIWAANDSLTVDKPVKAGQPLEAICRGDKRVVVSFP